jgi:hypothetical protein
VKRENRQSEQQPEKQSSRTVAVSSQKQKGVLLREPC